MKTFLLVVIFAVPLLPSLIFAQFQRYAWQQMTIQRPTPFAPVESMDQHLEDRLKAIEDAWTILHRTNPLNDEVTTTYMQGELAITTFPKRKPIVYFNISSQWALFDGASKTPVRLRFDKGQPFTQYWIVSEDRQTAYAPHEYRFLDALLSAKTLAVQYETWPGRYVTGTIPVSGLKESDFPRYDKWHLKRVRHERVQGKHHEH